MFKGIFKTKTTQDAFRLPVVLQPVEPEVLCEEHADSLRRLKTSWSDTETWESRILPIVHRLAYTVGRLPYSARGLFSQPGGLFEASLQCAAFALDIMESSVQLERNIMAQHLLQNRLRAAVCAGSLCSFLATLSDRIQIKEVDENDNAFFELGEAKSIEKIPYEPLALPYVAWVNQKLQNNSELTLELTWETKPIPVSQARLNTRFFLASHVIDGETLAWLSHAGRLPLNELLKCLTFDESPDQAQSSVTTARNLGLFRACQLERERMGARLGEMLTPAGWEETLLRIIRARISRDWEINAKDSPLRKGGDGLFLFWPDVCPILLQDMKSFGLTDLPTDSQIWAGLLRSAGFTLTSKIGTPTVMIAVTPNAKPREAIKLADEYFFSNGKVATCKTQKRAFEVDAQSQAYKPSTYAALTQLTREILEATQGEFSEKLSEIIPEQPKLLMHLASDGFSKELTQNLQKLVDTLNKSEYLMKRNLVDEGLFVDAYTIEQFYETSFELFINRLTKQQLIFMNSKNEPLWVTHCDANNEPFRGVVLKPSIFSFEIKEKDTLTRIDFERAFYYLHRRKASANLKESQSAQLTLPIDEEVSNE